MSQLPYGPPPQGTPISAPPPHGNDPYGPPPQNAPLVQAPPQSAFPPPVMPAAGLNGQAVKPPLYKRAWFIVVVVIAALAVIGSALSKKDDAQTTSASAGVSTPSQQVEAPPSSASSVPSVASTPSAVASTQAPAPQAPAVNFTMPNFVGMDLQSAQNLVQTNGVFFSQSHDLLGSRNQLVDSNWLVCDQNIPAAQQVTGDAEGLIDFGVVKRGEVCP